MNNRDLLHLSVLVGLGAFIWGRDLGWLAAAEEVLPILAAFPLFIWLISPWKFRTEQEPIQPRALAVAATLVALGILLDLTFLLAAGWTALLWAWLSVRLEPVAVSRARRLLLLPLLAFPWITLDLQSIGWWFRLTGAAATAELFQLTGFETVREGTNLLINGRPISVEAACSGMQTLQSMLVAGVVTAFIALGNSKRYWPNLLILLPLAWLSNTLRIIVLSLATILISPEFAQGAFHDWGGIAVVLLMFALCCAWFQWQNKMPPSASPVPPGTGSLSPLTIHPRP